jgi:hypothetical protein
MWRIITGIVVGSILGLGLGIILSNMIPKLLTFDVGSFGYFLMAWIIGGCILLILFFGTWFFKNLLDRVYGKKEEEKLIIKLGHLQVNYDEHLIIDRTEDLEPVYLGSHRG